MKSQVKVSTTQQYSDSQGEHVVHKGKLIFLTEQSPHWVLGELYREVGTDRIFRGNTTNQGIQKNSTFESIKPLIISETEEIEVGDYFLVTNKHNSQFGEIIKCFKSNDEYINEESFDNLGWHKTNIAKILALPEHFSDKHLEAIVDGKMGDGDEVYIKLKVCDYSSYRSSCDGDGWLSKDHGQASETCPKCGGAGYFVDFDQQNHITLFPAQQSLNEFAGQYCDEHTYDNSSRLKVFNAVRAGAEWAVKNNYKRE